MRQSVMEYREAVHRMFKGQITPAELRARGLPPFTRQRRGRSIQEQIDFGAGAAGPGNGAQGADDGARARQPH